MQLPGPMEIVKRRQVVAEHLDGVLFVSFCTEVATYGITGLL